MNWDICQKNYPIKQVSISNLKNYLKDRGWNEEPFRREELLKYKSPRPFHADRYMEVFIPSHDEISQEDLIDYKRTVEIAIDSISSFEKRSFEDVLSQILNFGDILKIQISTPKTKKGIIPIIDGINLYQGLYDLLAYSACAEISSPKKSFLTKLRRAVDFVETCQIGQSQYGSFVANIQCQLERPRYLNQEANRSFMPIGRKAILRILRGIKNINDAIQEQTPEPIIKNYSEGLNANMCDTLIDIIDIGQNTDIKISTSLEPVWEIPETIITDMSVTPYAKGYLVEASRSLRSESLIQENPEERCELKGYVFQLKKRPDEDERTIRILTIDDDGEFLPVVIKLDEDTYRSALHAHENSNLIKITGVLKKIGRTWILDDPEELRIVQNDSI